MEKTLKYLNEKIWYRLLKVFFIFLFVVGIGFLNLFIFGEGVKRIDQEKTQIVCLFNNNKVITPASIGITLSNSDFKNDEYDYKKNFTGYNTYNAKSIVEACAETEVKDIYAFHKRYELGLAIKGWLPEDKWQLVNQVEKADTYDKHKYLDFNYRLFNVIPKYSYKEFPLLFLIGNILIIFAFELLRRTFYYIVLGKVFPDKKYFSFKTKNEDNINKSEITTKASDSFKNQDVQPFNTTDSKQPTNLKSEGDIINKKEISSQKKVATWKIALACVCVGILAYGFFFSKNPDTNLGYLIGSNLVYTTIIGGIFYFVVAKKHGNFASWFSFFIILVSLVISSYIGEYQMMRGAKQAVTNIEDKLIKKQLINGSQNRTTNINTTHKANGDFGEIETFIKERIDEVASINNNYQKELIATGLNEILDPQRLKKDVSLIESKTIVQKANELAKKYNDKSMNSLNEGIEKINSLDISPSLKQKMLIGYKTSMEQAKIRGNAAWTLESKIIKEFENIINFLSARNGAWTIKDNQILFQNDNDIQKINSYYAEIKNLQKQQSALITEISSTVNQKFDTLKKAVQ